MYQALCSKERCNQKIGFVNQPAAYFNKGWPYCPKHIDIDRKAILDAAAEEHSEYLRKWSRDAEAARMPSYLNEAREIEGPKIFAEDEEDY